MSTDQTPSTTPNFEGLNPAQKAAVASMQATKGQLMLWPTELKGCDLLDLENRGIVYHIFHGPDCYAHTSWHLVEPKE